MDVTCSLSDVGCEARKETHPFPFSHLWALPFWLQSLQSSILKRPVKKHLYWLRRITQSRKKRKFSFCLLLGRAMLQESTSYPLHCQHSLRVCTNKQKPETLLFCIQTGNFPTLRYHCELQEVCPGLC